MHTEEEPFSPLMSLNATEPWLPDRFNYLALTEAERKIYNALYYHQGAAAAIKVEALAAEAFYFRPKTWRERTVRDILKALTEEHKIAIATSCSKPYGVYLVIDPDELLTYTRNLTSRALSMLTRAASLKKISLPALLGQLALDTEDHGNNPSPAR